jgi:hypothetical protein
MSPSFSYVVILQLKAASPVIGFTDASEAVMILVAWYIYSVLISSASADSYLLEELGDPLTNMVVLLATYS